MLKKLLVIATLTAGLISTQASAAFVTTDWKIVGDKSATLDTDTGLEWLNLSNTVGKSVNEIESMLETDYVGWRLPNRSEVRSLIVRFFDLEASEEVNTGATSRENADRFKSLFGNGENAVGLFYGLDGYVSTAGINHVQLTVWIN